MYDRSERRIWRVVSELMICSRGMCEVKSKYNQPASSSSSCTLVHAKQLHKSIRFGEVVTFVYIAEPEVGGVVWLKVLACHLKPCHDVD